MSLKEHLERIAELLEKNNSLLEKMSKKMEEWFKDDVRQHDERLKEIKKNKKDPIHNAA